MSGILAKSNLYKSSDYELFFNSAKKLKERGNDEAGYLFTTNYSLAFQRLKTNAVDEKNQPLSVLDNHIIADSQIINKKELVQILLDKNIKVDENDEGQILLKLLMNEGVNAFNMINGCFSLAYVSKDKLIAARDPFGIRSLYYSFVNEDIIVSSNIKSILEYKQEAIVDKKGIQELLGLGPSNSIGNTIYKDVFELKPGHYLEFSKDSFAINKYYELEATNDELSYEETKVLVEELLKDSTFNLANNSINPCSFLSGGLDSSVVTLYLNDMISDLKTYSMDYVQEENEYKSNQFETSNDQEFIPFILKDTNIIHKNNKVDVNTLANTLKDVVVHNDGPGMADIDGALLWLCKQVASDHKVIFTGEGSDEIFGGYPWYYREDGSQTGFPWLRNLEFRESLLKQDVKEKLNLSDYVKEKYEEVENETPLIESDTPQGIRHRQLSYVTMNYFMKTLLKRSEIMSMAANTEIRMPFSDKRLVELMYNTSFDKKYKDNTEKALLRDACKDILPEEIYGRKKSPFPKVRSKMYEREVTKLLKEALENKDSCLYQLFDINKINEILDESVELELPWYGQLMRKPQLIAYLYQIDYWYKTYNIKFEI